MKEVKTAWRWWTGWKIERLENWLEEMEQKGWNLVKVDYAFRFKFEKGESRKMRYSSDYQINVKNDYFELFKEDGWELVDFQNDPWFIWRKSYQDERPSVYTDTKSLIERNNRQIRSIIIMVPVTLLIFVVIGYFFKAQLISALIIMSLVFYGYLIAQLYQHNKKLKQNTINC